MVETSEEDFINDLINVINIRIELNLEEKKMY